MLVKKLFVFKVILLLFVLVIVDWFLEFMLYELFENYCWNWIVLVVFWILLILIVFYLMLLVFNVVVEVMLLVFNSKLVMIDFLIKLVIFKFFWLFFDFNV